MFPNTFTPTINMNSFDINLPSYMGFDFESATPLFPHYQPNNPSSNDYSEVCTTIPTYIRIAMN